MGNRLGVPIDIQGNKADKFQYLVDLVAGEILYWASLHLSQAVKFVLIQTVLLSISSYVMKCLKLPISVENKIDSLISRF